MRRISTYSTRSKSNAPESRPVSQVFPALNASLAYTFVRDFAYLASHPLHYGPPLESSGLETPASERSRRLSDPAIGGWEDSRNQWSATPPWMADTNYNSNRDQLPAMTFHDGGPPYSEDEDLRSPVVTSKSRHKKSRSNTGERGRSPGGAGLERATMAGGNGQYEEHRPARTDELDGPGGEIETYSKRREPYHRDSNFAKPLQRPHSPYDYRESVSEEERSEDGDDDDDDEARYSRHYQFTIASPDEEMHGKAVALFDFVPEHENELSLKEGQIILVSYRHGQGWLVAEDMTGESGLVPEEFVRLVSHIEGGLHRLTTLEIEEGATTANDHMSPVINEPITTTGQTQDTGDAGGRTPTPNNGGTWSEKHPAVQSNFSTSSRDFSPLRKEGAAMSPDKSEA
ncbi:HOG (high osmolarity glycerol) pathway protein [Lithohypha guttulata]|uniref:HOG (high osmolarity glycerol) pathway protein n=1 Tax=Lithohypha guttulata TaxID=1690604 RepID=UPI002DDF42C8|nr:HOG (high osmolarity glycerol) pathway protein [Lithohypha guttulata]